MVEGRVSLNDEICVWNICVLNTQQDGSDLGRDIGGGNGNAALDFTPLTVSSSGIITEEASGAVYGTQARLRRESSSLVMAKIGLTITHTGVMPPQLVYDSVYDTVFNYLFIL